MLLLVASSVDPWKWHAHPDVWAIFTTSLILYWYAITRIGPRVVPPGQTIVTRRQVAWFCSGVAALWLVSDWPIHEIGEQYLYSVHMFQHLVMTLVVPPMLLLGVPGWLTRWILRPPALAASVRVLCRPLVAAIIFNTTVAINHWPALVNAVLEHHALHFVVHLWAFSAAMLMWFPVVNKLPEFPRLSAAGKMVYLFLQSVIPNVPVAFLAFATGVVYKFYATVPRPFGWTAVEDQQTAAAIMKVGGTFIIWGIILVVFFRWYGEWEAAEKAERDKRRRAPATPVAGANEAPLTWADVERELAATPPAPGSS
jgi:putative membrane protein